MADVQLRDEAVRDRIRAAEEFLDPSEWAPEWHGEREREREREANADDQ